jgi:hypothetical protein
MVFLLPLLVVLLGLTNWTMVANIPRASIEPSPGKAFYTIYPQQETNVSTTEDFIKTTIDADDLRPWPNLHGTLISWTIEVSPEEVQTLRSNGRISRVDHLDLLKKCENIDNAVTRTTTSKDVPSCVSVPYHSLSARSGANTSPFYYLNLSN